MTTTRLERAFVVPPDPGGAGTLDELSEALRLLKVWAGDPSYDTIKDRVNAMWRTAGRPLAELTKKTTVADCFRPGRRRLNTDLMIAVVQALHPDVGYVTQWRQALRVIGGEAGAAAQVRVLPALPRDLDQFTGRDLELDRLRQAGRGGGTAAVCAITGMAGIGKTQLAIRAGHMLHEEKPFDRVLFVNLRGFHPDPLQPPADPVAVLDGFLRVLGTPGERIPHSLPARAAAYRDRLAGTRTLVVLDNAADEEQVRPLVAGTPGCLTLITSRRRLAGLRAATHLVLEVFTPDEAVAFLTRAASQAPVGPDQDAPGRVARRCGYLPLALGLVTGQMRAKPGWTLTDHADRLDERHRDRRLDTGVELALDLSYQHLPAGEQRLLRLAALHPGQDFDLWAAAALAGTDLPATRTHLRHLCRDHLLQQSTPGRYAFHDLVRDYAADRGSGEDRPSERRAALTHLFDHYLATAAAAMHALYPADAQDHPSRNQVVADAARSWLDTERPTLVAVAVHTAGHGWPSHATRLSTTLYRYLDGGHHADALVVHGHAAQAAHDMGDLSGQARALTNLGVACLCVGRYEPAAGHLRRALDLFRRTGDTVGQARTLGNIGNIEVRLGRHRPAADHYQRALALFRQAGDRFGEARLLDNVGLLEARLGRYRRAIDRHEQALALFRRTGDRGGQARAWNNLGDVEGLIGRYRPAAAHLQRALRMYRRLGSRTGEAWALDSLGILHTHLGEPDRATRYHLRALATFHEIGERDGEAWALNGLGAAAGASGRTTDAITHHTRAHAIATDTGALDQQARAHAGLGCAHDALGRPAQARWHYTHALTLYAELGMPEADRIHAQLGALGSAGA